MKFVIIIVILSFIPIHVTGQNQVLKDQTSPVIIKTQDEKNLQLITPILLRNSLNLFNDHENSSRSGNMKINPFLQSLVLPGLGQLKNRTWWKAGLFFAIEASSLFVFLNSKNKAKTGERKYEKYADRNWSVVQYSNWLLEYHDINGLDNPHIDELRQMLGNTEASFNPEEEWGKVDIEILRELERDTRYVTPDQKSTNNFSHTLPEYGSQQYYELISKYYQYQGGWKDYNQFHDSIGHTGPAYSERFLIDRNGLYASPYFFDGATMAEEFNSNYRRSNTFLSILIANHVLSAFDAYFTFKLKQNRLVATSSIMPGKQIQLTYRF